MKVRLIVHVLLALSKLISAGHSIFYKTHLRPAKIHICLRTQAVWSVFAGHSVKPRIQSVYMLTTKTLVRLPGCTSRSESSLGENRILLCPGSYILLFYLTCLSEKKFYNKKDVWLTGPPAATLLRTYVRGLVIQKDVGWVLKGKNNVS